MRKGITFIELIIVLALLSILTSIATVNILGSTDTARLRSDVQSTIIIQSAIQLYMMEFGSLPSNYNSSQIINRLNHRGLIPHITDSTQLQNVTWFYDATNNRIFLDLRYAGQHIIDRARNLSEQERRHVKMVE